MFGNVSFLENKKNWALPLGLYAGALGWISGHCVNLYNPNMAAGVSFLWTVSYIKTLTIIERCFKKNCEQILEWACADPIRLVDINVVLLSTIVPSGITLLTYEFLCANGWEAMPFIYAAAIPALSLIAAVLHNTEVLEKNLSVPFIV